MPIPVGPGIPRAWLMLGYERGQVVEVHLVSVEKRKHHPEKEPGHEAEEEASRALTHTRPDNTKNAKIRPAMMKIVARDVAAISPRMLLFTAPPQSTSARSESANYRPRLTLKGWTSPTPDWDHPHTVYSR